MAEGTVPVLIYQPPAQIDDDEVPVRVLHSGNRSSDEMPVCVQILTEHFFRHEMFNQKPAAGRPFGSGGTRHTGQREG